MARTATSTHLTIFAVTARDNFSAELASAGAAYHSCRAAVGRMASVSAAAAAHAALAARAAVAVKDAVHGDTHAGGLLWPGRPCLERAVGRK